MTCSLTKRENFPKALVMCICFLIISVLTAFTPLIADDFSYSFSLVDDARIASLKQIFESLAVHRSVLNGRMFSHFLVYLFLMLPKAVFNLCNGLVAVLLLYCTGRCMRTLSPWKDALLLAVWCGLIWCFLPAFGQTVLWLDGACNYSWGIALMLLFLLRYIRDYLNGTQKRSAVKNVLLILLGFVVGAYSENGGAATIFMAFCFFVLIWHRDRKMPVALLAAILAGCLGYLFLMSAPATAATRSGEFSISAIANSIVSILNLAKDRLLILYCLYFALLVLVWQKADKKRVILSLVFFVGGAASLACFAFAAYFTLRHFCFTVFFTVLAVLVLLCEFFADDKLGKRLTPVFASVLAVCFAFSFALGCIDILSVYKSRQERLTQIMEAKAAGETEIVLDAISPATEYSAQYGLDDLLGEASDWPNTSWALYYGFDSMTGNYID